MKLFYVNIICKRNILQQDYSVHFKGGMVENYPWLIWFAFPTNLSMSGIHHRCARDPLEQISKHHQFQPVTTSQVGNHQWDMRTELYNVLTLRNKLYSIGRSGFPSCLSADGGVVQIKSLNIHSKNNSATTPERMANIIVACSILKWDKGVSNWTGWSTIQGVIARGWFEITSTITPWIVRHKLQLLINRICKGWFTRYDFDAYDKLMTGLRHELFRVNQTYNLLTTVVYVKKNVVGFWNVLKRCDNRSQE